MKKLILLTLTFHFVFLGAQSVPGLNKIADSQLGCSFIFKDKSSTVWIGLGSYTYGQGRLNYGLKKIVNQQTVTEFNSGIFTDVLETDSCLFFSSYNGLYTYKNGSFQLNSSAININCMTMYKNQVWLGTSGSGMYQLTSQGLKHIEIKINGRSYDSILSVYSQGKIMWIGTTQGLVRYDENAFTNLNVPVVKTMYSIYESRQKRILSIQMDGYGKLWIANDNILDTIPGVYYLENNAFVDPMLKYRENCAEIGTIPFRVNKLGRTDWGHILIGTWWGVIELSDEILNYPIHPELKTENYVGVSNMKFAYNTNAYESSDGLLYASTKEGIMELDRNTFQSEQFRKIKLEQNYSSEVIDINDIKASVANDGTMFNQPDIMQRFLQKPVLNTESISCADMMFVSGLWIGGESKSDGKIRTAAQTYRTRGTDFVPGPINTNTFQFDSILSKSYNRIWKIDRKTIDEFIANRNQSGYSIPQEILDWPANSPSNVFEKMAPYVDVDLNQIYEPSKGDYPLIKGDQMLWWVFNDVCTQSETGGQNMYMQVNASCYAYKNILLSPSDSDFIFNRTVFIEYQILNLGYESYNNLYAGIFNDVDLGNYSDDEVGCDTTENAGFAFNGDNLDEGKYGFGKNPPMIFCKFLNHKMEHFSFYNSNNNPIDFGFGKDSNYYAYMRSGYFQNKSLVLNEPFQSPFYPCQYSDSMRTAGDRRFIMSCKLSNIAPGSSDILSFAYIVLHDPNKNILKDDCNKPKQTLAKIQYCFDRDSFPNFAYWPTEIENLKTPECILYPNPAMSILQIQMGNSNTIDAITIYDLQGKIIGEYTGNGTHLQLINIADLSSGLYTIEIKSNGFLLRSKFIKYE